MLPQDHALPRGGTVWEILDHDLTEAGVPGFEHGARITRALRRVGLSGVSDLESTRLSSPQRQRVAIAGMLAHDIDLVIVDEPIAPLDPQFAGDTVGLLRLLAEHAPVIVVTHDLRVASLCDRTVVLTAAIDPGDIPHRIHRPRASPPPSRRLLALVGTLCILLAVAG